MIREHFEQTMLELQTNMLEMVHLTDLAFDKAFNALETHNISAALSVIEEDQIIDDLEMKINQTAIWFLAQQQPVAQDLRRIISFLKITSDIERIADFAVNTAKSVVKIQHDIDFLPSTSILSMKNQTQDMLKKAVLAFINENLKLAIEVGGLDDSIDKQYYANLTLIKQQLIAQPEKTDELVELLFINRFVERTADHVTNIAESVAYYVKGEMVDLN